MGKPRRIQRKRTKGWKMPPNTVYVGRPTKWGNPYEIGSVVEISSNFPEKAIKLTSNDAVLSMFLQYVGYHQMLGDDFWKSIMRKLKGKNLACWCPLDQPCHADVLLEIANA